MVKFRIATNEDNLKLLELTSSTEMAGEIGLRIDRHPDFFSLLKMRGETKVFVAEEEDKIIGCLCVALKKVYIDGEIFPLQYIGDFKVSGPYRKKGIGLQLCNEMADYLISQNSDLVFLNVSKGNKYPISFFKNRPHVPDFEKIGLFKIFQFIGKKMNFKVQNYTVEEIIFNDEVYNFLTIHYKRYQMGTVLSPEKLNDARTLIIREKGEIIAAMCLIDTMKAKQNVVTSISWRLKCILKIINGYSPIAGLSKMPLLHEPVKMLYIKYLAVNSNKRKLVKLLVNCARNIAFEKSYSFVSLGLHEKDKFNSCLSGIPKLTFRSEGMLVSIKNNQGLINKIKDGIPYVDFSLV